MPASSAQRIELSERGCGHHRAAWIGRRAHDHAFERVRSMLFQQSFGSDRPSCLRRRLDAHRLATERAEDVAIRRITRQRRRHAIARFEGGEERQNEAGRRAGGDNDACRIDFEAVPLGVGVRDTPAQRGDAERFGIAEASGGERGARRSDRGCRRAGSGLADFHMNNPAALRLQPGRGGDNVHHHERRHRAARRRLQQIFSSFEHQLVLVRGRSGTAPLPPHSAGLVTLSFAQQRAGPVLTVTGSIHSLGPGPGDRHFVPHDRRQPS